MMASTDKIGPQHLGRPAVVYVRQSTISQVRHHHESRRRQYDLAARAKQLGWREVSVIDEDLGRSGASSAGRTGFKHLVAETGLGHIGAIFAIEVSRLARNNRDWYQLLDLCGLMDTLIIDDEGIYNTRQPNDRLLLGLKGTISEAELGWIRQRAQQGLLSKARRGELVLGLPVGYVKAPGGRIEKAPDARVREAIELVFRKFAELGSVRQRYPRWNASVAPASRRIGAFRSTTPSTRCFAIRFMPGPMPSAAPGLVRAWLMAARIRRAAIGGNAKTGSCCCASITRVISTGTLTNAIGG